MSERIRGDANHLLQLVDVSQREVLLVGGLSIDSKSPEEPEGPGPVLVIEGRKDANGTFWPSVELQIRSEPNGKWLRIATPVDEKAPAQLTIYSGMSVDGMRVNLEPFKPYIGRFKLGRILLKSGEAATFELQHLVPPQ